MPDEGLESVLIVSRFSEVFSKDLRGFPLVREVEFSIDLIPGCVLISKLSYRMTSTELKELKVQLEDLQKKGFIRSSV